MSNRKKIGDVIKELRKKKKLSQRKLASMLGISNTALSKIENNNITYFNMEILQRIAKALDTTVDEIMKQVENPENTISKSTSEHLNKSENMINFETNKDESIELSSSEVQEIINNVASSPEVLNPSDDVPIEEMEDFLAGFKHLMFKGQLLSERDIRVIYAFTKKLKEEFDKRRK